MSSQQAIVLDKADSVAVALADFAPGDEVAVRLVEQTLTLNVLEAVPFGHKVAIRSIAKGEAIIKYGEVIGGATADIPAGAWVHTHNLETRRARKAVS